jgi:hypothetical protein
MENKKKTIYDELIDLQDLIKKESSLKELCKSFFIYQSK